MYNPHLWLTKTPPLWATVFTVAIFYPFSQFCEINISLLSLQTQPNTAPNLFQRGVEYGKYGICYLGLEEQSHLGAPGPSKFEQCYMHYILVVWLFIYMYALL